MAEQEPSQEADHVTTILEPPQYRWAKPTPFQQRLVIGFAVAAAVTFCATIIFLCVMLMVQVSI